MCSHLVVPQKIAHSAHGVRACRVRQVHADPDKREVHTCAKFSAEALHRRKRRLWITHHSVHPPSATAARLHDCHLKIVTSMECFRDRFKVAICEKSRNTTHPPNVSVAEATSACERCALNARACSYRAVRLRGTAGQFYQQHPTGAHLQISRVSRPRFSLFAVAPR